MNAPRTLFTKSLQVPSLKKIPYIYILFLLESFQYYPIYAEVFQVIFFLQIFPPKTLNVFLFSPMRVTCLTYLILLDMIS